MYIFQKHDKNFFSHVGKRDFVLHVFIGWDAAPPAARARTAIRGISRKQRPRLGGGAIVLGNLSDSNRVLATIVKLFILRNKLHSLSPSFSMQSLILKLPLNSYSNDYRSYRMHKIRPRCKKCKKNQKMKDS